MIKSCILLVVLMFLNGLFSACEMAFVSINKTELEEDVKKGSKKAKKIKKLLGNSSSFLATIQICITLAGFLASAFAAETFAQDLYVKIAPFVSIPDKILENGLIVIVTLILSYFTLVFSELFPKKIALASPMTVARLTVNIVDFFQILFYPIVVLLTFSTNLMCKIFRIKIQSEDKITEKEIISIISKGKQEGIIESVEGEMLLNIFKFDDKKVEDVMTIREKMIAVDTYISEKALLHVIRECKYSRIPVYEEKLDNIIGILNTKDLILQYSKEANFNIKNLIRPVVFVQTDEIVDDVFKMMQEKNIGMVIVRKKDRTAGLLTLEDAMEEIFGNISDEYN